MHWDKAEDKESKQISPGKEKANLERIQQTKATLDETIQELNQKLQTHFQKKQQELIQQYKKELIEAQKELNQLKSTTNEQQIKNKMLERKKELERERHHLIQTNLFFSSKCQEYKKKLSELVAEGKELQRELIFLDSQLNSTNKRKYQALSAQDLQLTPKEPTHHNSQHKPQQATALPLFSDRKPAQQRKLANSVSVRQTNKKNILEQSLAQRSRKNIIKAQLPKIVLQKTPIQELFQTTVADVRDRRKGKKVINLKGEQFSDYEKKIIMEQFLSKEEVKKKIYEIIFETEQKIPMLSHIKPENKVKISYQDIG